MTLFFNSDVSPSFGGPRAENVEHMLKLRACSACKHHHHSFVCSSPKTFIARPLQSKQQHNNHSSMSTELGPVRRSSRRGAKKRVYSAGDLVEIHDVSSNKKVALFCSGSLIIPLSCRWSPPANPEELRSRNRIEPQERLPAMIRIGNQQDDTKTSHILFLLEIDGSGLPRTPGLQGAGILRAQPPLDDQFSQGRELDGPGSVRGLVW